MEYAVIDKVKAQLKNLKVLSEELRVQMALGKAEAKDLMEAEKQNLSKYFAKQKRQIDKTEQRQYKDRANYLHSLQNLESLLNEKVPGNKVKYDKYKTEILKLIYKLEEMGPEVLPEYNNEMNDLLEAYKAKMDAFRVNLALHDEDDPQKVERIQKEFTEKLNEVRVLLSKREEQSSRLEHFAEDITESFNYLKRAIADLSNE
jgi:hypothetical protein